MQNNSQGRKTSKKNISDVMEYGRRKISRYACTLSLIVATNVLTALIFHQWNYNAQSGHVEPLHYSYHRNCSEFTRVKTPDYEIRPPLSTVSPTIFVVTATHTCATQKVDLTSLCQTLTLVPKLVWIVVEDSTKPTKLVSDLLERCALQSVHLNVPTSDKYKSHLPWPLYRIFGTVRGVEQRNAGLRWLRENFKPHSSSGVVYFADDDNKFDLRIFTEIRKTKKVSVFKVGFAGGLYYEGPVCDENERVKQWHSPSAEWSIWATARKIPIDMAGFAVNLDLILTRPAVWMGRDTRSHDSKVGQLETNLLEHFTTREQVECRGLNTEVLVWHTKTADPNLKHEFHYHSDTSSVAV